MKTSETVTTRKMSIYWLTLLLFNGINVYPGHNNKGAVRLAAAVYPWLIYGFWLFIITSTSTSLFIMDVGYETKFEALSMLTGSSSTLALFAIGVRKRPHFDSMLSLIRHEFWDDGRRSGADVLYTAFVRTYGVIFPVANVAMCVTPGLFAVMNGNINSPNAFIFRMWTPWPRLTTATYAAAYAVQFTVSLCVLISITGMVLAMILVVNEMQVQIDTLIDAVRGLPVEHLYDDADGPDDASGPDDVDGPDDAVAGSRSNVTAAATGLVRCLKHHQMLIAYFNHFKSYFNLLFVVDIIYITVMACLCASSVMLSNGLLFRIKMISLLTVVVSQFFFYCLIGEKFSLMNKQFGNCVYFKLVKCKDTTLTRIGCLILLRTQRPLQLSAMGITKYSASLFTFASTMRSAYAGLNVLYNSLEKTNKLN